MFVDDTNLWAEIKEKGDAVVLGWVAETLVRRGRQTLQNIGT